MLLYLLYTNERGNEMRKLSAKQKKFLVRTGAHHVLDLQPEIFDKIEAMNNYETFYQDADRFLSDEYFRRMNERDSIDGECQN